MSRFHRSSLLLALSFVLCVGATLDAREAGAEYNHAVKTTPLFRTSTDVAGNALVYPTDGRAEVSGLLVELPPGAETGWHRHNAPCFAYIIEGEIAVAQKDGPTRTFKAGDAFAELVGVSHNGRTIGDRPVRLVFFAAGAEGRPFTTRD